MHETLTIVKSRNGMKTTILQIDLRNPKLIPLTRADWLSFRATHVFDKTTELPRSRGTVREHGSTTKEANRNSASKQLLILMVNYVASWPWMAKPRRISNSPATRIPFGCNLPDLLDRRTFLQIQFNLTTGSSRELRLRSLPQKPPLPPIRNLIIRLLRAETKYDEPFRYTAAGCDRANVKFSGEGW